MIIDISLPIGPATPVWPGDPPVVVEAVARIEAGDPAAVSRLVLGTHTGTHVDPPAHFLPGAVTVDAIPLDVLIGPAVVADLSSGAPIDALALESLALPAGTTRLLLKTTGPSGSAAAPANAAPGAGTTGAGATGAWTMATEGAVTAEAGRWLVDRGVRLVGIDTLSIEPAGAGRDAAACPPEERYPVHRILLGAGVVIVEGLDLSAAPAGDYQLLCLPLRIAGGDGAPARAVLIAP